jgi:hypothetical protein
MGSSDLHAREPTRHLDPELVGVRVQTLDDAEFIVGREHLEVVAVDQRRDQDLLFEIGQVAADAGTWSDAAACQSCLGGGEGIGGGVTYEKGMKASIMAFLCSPSASSHLSGLNS